MTEIGQVLFFSLFCLFCYFILAITVWALLVWLHLKIKPCRIGPRRCVTFYLRSHHPTQPSKSAPEMSSWQLPVASDLIDRVLGEIFGPIISRLIRRDIHQLRRLDSLVAVPLFSGAQTAKEKFSLERRRLRADQSIHPPRLSPCVLNTTYISRSRGRR